MDIQKSYPRDLSQNYSYPITENFEYSSITSSLESLLSIDQIYRSVLSTEPHSTKLTFKVKKLATGLKSNQDPFISFFSYLPPILKQDLAPLQVMSIFVEDFSSEVPDFHIELCIFPVSRLLSHTGRPQEVFEKEIPDGKPRVVAFELNWDVEVTMENVAKVLKSIPGNIQSIGFLEIASMIVCTGNYYSSICKNQENWKCCDKFYDKEPISWVKTAWVMVSGLKYPSTIIYQRVEGYKSTANFITSLDFENLIKFARKQDEKAKLVPKNSEGLNLQEPKPKENLYTIRKYDKSPKEAKDNYSRPESRFSNAKSKTLSYNPEPLVPEPQPEDPQCKPQGIISKKFEYQETKTTSLDDKFKALSEKYSFKPNIYNISKQGYKNEDQDNIEKITSQKNREDSFHSLDRNDEINRLQLGSPKDKDYPRYRAFSRQEGSLTQLPYTPQKNLPQDFEKFPNQSSKDSDDKSEGPNFLRDRFNIREKYSKLIKDNKPSYNIEGEDLDEKAKRFFKDYNEEYNEVKDSKDEDDDKKKQDFDENKYKDMYQKDIGKNEIKSDLPRRGSYKSSLDALNKEDLLTRNYRSKIGEDEEQSKKPLLNYEEISEKYKFNTREKNQKSQEGDFLTGKKEDNYKDMGGEDQYIENPRFKYKDYKTPEIGQDLRTRDYKTPNEDFRGKEYKISNANEDCRPKEYKIPNVSEDFKVKDFKTFNPVEDYRGKEYKGLNAIEDNRAKDYKVPNDNEDYRMKDYRTPNANEDYRIKDYKSYNLNENLRAKDYKAPNINEEYRLKDYRTPNIDDDYKSKDYKTPNIDEDYRQKDYKTPNIDEDYRPKDFKTPNVDEDYRQKDYKTPNADEDYRQKDYKTPNVDENYRQKDYKTPNANEDLIKKDYKTPEAIIERYKQKNYRFENPDPDENLKKDNFTTNFDRNKYKNFKPPESFDQKSDTQAQEIFQDEEKEYKPLNERLAGRKFRDNEPGLYEKYNPPFVVKDEDPENEFKKPDEDLEQDPKTRISGYKKLNNDIKPSEKPYDFTGIKEDSFSRYNQFSKNDKPTRNLKPQDLNYEKPQIFPKAQELDLPSNALYGDSPKKQDSSDVSEWSCSKCEGKMQGSTYECTECRLINWDQFYKVKSLQHTRTKTEEKVYKPIVNVDVPLREPPNRRVYSFSDKKDEESSEWICSVCKQSNQSMFFLCKGCRKPRIKAQELSAEGKKEYKFAN
ncbi:hypothetical protein SteCoe_22004 [Stentor coeruleus]|uniref:RanBP2-type domain-containing protein n=1 Tax=Stentor coeruleus TaxID=5963 RepID=A0A1R2BN91_9CILI|nr:hypothetical protein SteCoe_22004 [Stentor coeruleus]